MPKWKIKRNALVNGLYSGFIFLNLLVLMLLIDMSGRVVLITLLMTLVVPVVTAMDRREKNTTDGAVCCALALHLIETAWILTKLYFHWSIVVLYFLELALCIYIWRIKITR